MWTETHIEELHLQNQALYARFLEEGIFDGAADVARVEILFRRGGIYADADSIALRALGDAEFLDADLFAVLEPGDEHPGLISNAFMGSSAENPILRDYIAAIASVKELRPMWRGTGPGALTDVIRRHEFGGVSILPAWIFFDTTLDGGEVTGGDAIGRHFWSTTAERWGRRGATPYPT
jgi:mannosyltransferase OCH1-like enzyme